VGLLVLGQADIAETAKTLVIGSLGSERAITGSLRETTPMLLAGLGVFLALRAGLFNIGVEGQFLLGGFTAAVVGSRIPGPIGVIVSLSAGIAAGALWAFPAGWIKAFRNGHEVITTIMLNNVAIALTDYLVAGPFRDPMRGSPSTVSLSSSTRLPNLIDASPLVISSGLVFGLIIAVSMSYWLKRRVAGYELQLVGANATAAEFAGVNVRKVSLSAMVASGGIGGLAGAVQTLAFEGRFFQGFSPGYGFDGLGVALLASGNALIVVPMSFLFGILSKGGTSLLILGVPKGITNVVTGIVILISAAIRYRKAAHNG
jgi:simple sugar transport system permease protein